LTRIDLTTREWHELIKPVLPHASTDADDPQLGVVRIQPAEHALYAVATDRYTIGAERFPLPAGERLWDVPGPVHIWRTDAAASLRLFPYSKDADPPLRVSIDKAPVPITVAGTPATVDRLAITLEAIDGTRLVMHDHRDPSSDPLAGWRGHLISALIRPQAKAAPALNLNAAYLARWSAAVRKGERLAVFTGTKGDQMLLIAVENHFLGVWQPVSYLESPADMLAATPWRDELELMEHDPS
jgi:hypothetical protein